MQIVIIVGVGRSGSTLLQRVINTMPRSNICGENRNAWLHVARFAQAWLQLRPSTRTEYEIKVKEADHFGLAWYNISGEETLIQALRQLFLTMYQGQEQAHWGRIGFKEIRIGQQGYEQMQAQLLFFRMIFPDCKIIFNLRDPNAILASQAREHGEFGDPSCQAHFYRFAKEHGAFLWHYEDWETRDKVRELYDYLEEPFSQEYKSALQVVTKRKQRNAS